MSRTTRAGPKNASRPCVASETLLSETAAGERTLTPIGAAPGSFDCPSCGARSRCCSIGSDTESRPRDESGSEADDEDERDEDERSCPGLRVPVFVWARCIDVDLMRKRFNRLSGRGRPELVAERGEEQRG